MIFLTSGRRGGKTVTLVRWFLEDPARRVILVNNQTDVKRVMDILAYLLPDPPLGIRERIIAIGASRVSDVGWLLCLTNVSGSLRLQPPP